MGRYVRLVLRNLAVRPDVELTLLVRDPRTAAVGRESISEHVHVGRISTARMKSAYDAVWYPWNGMRFPAGAPAVVTINDDFAFTYAARGLVARWREQWPVRKAAREATHIVTISQWARGALIERFALAPQRISQIPLGPDTFFSVGPETSPFREPFVLAVGAGEARKNVAFLIDAFERAFPGGDVRLVLVGDAPPSLQNQLRATHVPVDVLSHIDDLQLRRLYRSATVVAVPSLAEGFGLVAAEAQACGGAVIAANTTALPEAVGDAGLLVDPRDADAWRDALHRLVRDPALNARYRARATVRWTADSSERTAHALLATVKRSIDDSI